MSDSNPPGGRRPPSPHDVSPRAIALIFAVMIAGLGLGMLLVMPHYGPRKPRHRSALGHIIPASMIGRETNGMVWIPGGLFAMGSNDGKQDEAPIHEVNVAPIWMDKTEVTNEQFAKFVEETGYRTVSEVTSTNAVTWRHPLGAGSSVEGKELHPVVQISWEDAAAYAKWAGKRLPTEAEWEHAARGGLHQQRYSWGNEKPSVRDPRGNFPITGTNAPRSVVSVSRFPPNGYGLADITGNVAEWCGDWYQTDYYAISPNLKPKGPDLPVDDLQTKVIRGGSYLSVEDDLRVSARAKAPPRSSRADLGFRCVKDGY